MSNSIEPVKSYWLSLSGGKDSLYMLYYVLKHSDLYPLNGVVHFELEVDFPFIKDVVSFVRDLCLRTGLEFYSIKPRHSWEELYNKYGFPTRKNRWCNSKYKLDCQKQFVEWQKDLNTLPVFYIGYCVDEVSRYKKRNLNNEIYPLVDGNIIESDILDWAKNQDIYNDYYKYNIRCGCMFCPFSHMMSFTYLYEYYPDEFHYFFEKCQKTEIELSQRYNKKISCLQANSKYDSSYLLDTIKNKYLFQLYELENTFF